MNNSPINLGMVVQDRYGRIGIVCTREPAPPKDWIDEQLNVAEINALGNTEWWGVMPFGGGYSLAPGPLLEFVRETTFEDFVRAADTAKVTGRERLVKLFPAYVNKLLADRK